MNGTVVPPGNQESLTIEVSLQNSVPLLFKTLTNQCPDRLIVVH